MVTTPNTGVKKTMADTSGCCSSLSFSTGLMLSASLAYKICKLNKVFSSVKCLPLSAPNGIALFSRYAYKDFSRTTVKSFKGESTKVNITVNQEVAITNYI